MPKDPVRRQLLEVARVKAGSIVDQYVDAAEPVDSGPHRRLRPHVKFTIPTPMRMAGATGLEPKASCVTGRHFNNLNYAPALLVHLPDCSLPFPLIPNCVRKLTESVVTGLESSVSD